MKNNPYVGPRPFNRGEGGNFYGRNREARDLLSLIQAERVVLFYAQSGAGKTSLLNAQVIPALEEEGFNVLPIARVGGALPPDTKPEKVKNVFVFSALMGLAEATFAEKTLVGTLRNRTLYSFLEQIRQEDEAQHLEDEFYDRPPLLILDQFEELFTTHRERWQDARDFFNQLREALRRIPSLGIVFAMREDFIAEMDPYARQLPRRLRARFRMERLGYKGALEAVEKPAANASRPFDAEVAEKLVDDLRRIQTGGPPPPALVTAGASVAPAAGGEPGFLPVAARQGGTEGGHAPLGPHVEPVQLQVVCNRLWENLPDQKDRAIRWQEVQEFGNVDRALTDFYQGALARSRQETGVSERQLRRWFGEQLITPMQTRGLALRGERETGGLPNQAVDVLEAEHLIRAETRAGARWYELSHDRLVEPILQSNRAWEMAQETPLRTAARRWRETGDNALFYREAALAEALAWTEDHPDEVEPYETEFLEASRRAQQIRQRNRRLRITGTAVGTVVLMVVGWLAVLAARSSLLAQSQQAASQSLYLRATAPLESIRSARHGISLDSVSPWLQSADPILGEIDTIDAQLALRQALVDFYPFEVFEDLGSQTNGVVFSSDGRFLYTGLATGQMQTWVREGGALRAGPIFESQGAVRTLALSPDGRFLAAGGDADSIEGGYVALWDLEPAGEIPRPVKQLRVPLEEGVYDEVHALAFSPGGDYLAAGGDHGERWRDSAGLDPGMVHVWALETDTVALTLTDPKYRVNSLAWTESEGRSYLAAGSNDNMVRIWKIRPERSGGLTSTLALTLTAHTGAVTAVAWSPAENLLVSASADRTMRVWRLESDSAGNLNGAEAALTLVGHTADVTSIAFSRDGRYLVSGSRDRTVRLWDVMARNPNALVVLTGLTSMVNTVTMSPDVGFIAAGVGEGLYVWNRDSVRQQRLSTFSGHAGKVRGMAYSPDGRFLAAGDDSGAARLWSTETGETVRTLSVSDDRVWNLAYSPDGRYLVTCSYDALARVWDPSSGELVKELDAHQYNVLAAAFSPDGQYLTTASGDQTAVVWDTETWENKATLTREGYPGAVFAATFSPDGQLIATGHSDNSIRLWRLSPQPGGGLEATMAERLTGHDSWPYSLAFSPDGRYLASGSWDQTARLWSMDTYTSVQELEHPGVVYDVAYSPDGHFLATSARDGLVRMWSLDPPERPAELAAMWEGHSDIIWSIAFSPDGKYLASGSWDRTIRRYLVWFDDVWELAGVYAAE